MKKLIAIAMAGAAVVGMTGTAQAAVTFNISNISTVYSNGPTADIHKTSNPEEDTNNAKLSPQTLKGTLSSAPGVPVEFFAYCVDIFQTSGTGDFNVVSLQDHLGSSAAGVAKYNQIARLISQQGAKVSAAHDASVQLAIWEIINETLTTQDIDKIYTYEQQWSWNQWKYINVDVSAPQFWADDIRNGSSSILTDADTYLNASKSGNVTPGLNLYVAQSGSKQDFLFWSVTPPAVPEPTTWAMMLLGFGTIGYTLRAKRRNSAISFS